MSGSKKSEVTGNKAGEALKPCPFCGGVAGLHTQRGEAWVECYGCGVLTGIDRHTQEQAISIWNSRAKESERTEFAQILAGLKARGVITQDDVDRLERDGMKEVAHA